MKIERINPIEPISPSHNNQPHERDDQSKKEGNKNKEDKNKSKTFDERLKEKREQNPGEIFG